MTIPRRDFLTGALTLSLASAVLPKGLVGTKVEDLGEMMHDCLIIGGGIAGLSSALGLGRARRSTLLCTAGPPRNAPAPHAHNFVTRDGTPPLELLSIARKQLEPYQKVTVVEKRVESVTRSDDGRFVATLDDGQRVQARTVILATGMRDDLSSIDGLERLWGDSIFACPFCHGWEYRDRRWAVMTNESMDLKMVKLARSWTKDLLVCGPSGFTPTEEQADQLERLAIPFYTSSVIGLEGGQKLTGIKLADGRSVACEAMLHRPLQHQRSSIPAKLGCEMNGAGCVQTKTPFGSTNIPGLFAVGDMVGPMQSLITASAAGSYAAGGVVHTLIEQDFERALS